MSTGLDIKGIDSKIDDFTAKQLSSQQITFGHLEKIEERVQTAAGLQSTSLAETAEISRSTSKIHETLHDIQKSQATSHQTTCVQAERLDATLAAIQRSLLGISTKNRQVSKTRRKILKPQPRKHGLPESRHEEVPSMPGVFSELVQQTADHSIVPAQINKLVDLAVTVRYRCGKAHFEPLALPDPEFEAASFETKLRMVKYLQDLRLLLWLLCRKEYFCDRAFQLTGLLQSQLIPEARLASSWTVWTTSEVASFGPKAKIRCRDEASLEYLQRMLCIESFEFGSKIQTQNSLYPSIGLRIWQSDLEGDHGQALKLRLARQQANLKKLVHKRLMMKVVYGITRPRLDICSMDHIYVNLEDSLRWLASQIDQFWNT